MTLKALRAGSNLVFNNHLFNKCIIFPASVEVSQAKALKLSTPPFKAERETWARGRQGHM